MDKLDIQQVFLNQIKEKIPSNYSLVDELSDTLEISSDSAYRRIRGATPFTIDEVYKISQKYGLSLDSLSSIHHNSVSFEYMSFINYDFNSVSYLTKILDDLNNINSFVDKEIIYAAKDIPIFQLFVIPEIAMFKTFFWTKTIASLPELENVKFSVNHQNQEVLELCNKILNLYLKISSTEIWSEDTITSIIKQIEYYFDCGLFESKEDALQLCYKLKSLLDHIKNQAQSGVKHLLNGSISNENGAFKMYLNEIVLPDNTIIVQRGDDLKTYLSHDVMNYLITHNEQFSKSTLNTIQNVIKRSTLISKSSERERSRFFQKMCDKINTLQNKIEIN